MELSVNRDFCGHFFLKKIDANGITNNHKNLKSF